MMLADVVRLGGTSCPLCQGHDHEEKDCALAITRSTQPQKVEQFLKIGQRMMESVVGSIDLGAVSHPDVASSTSACAVEGWTMGQQGVAAEGCIEAQGGYPYSTPKTNLSS